MADGDVHPGDMADSPEVSEHIADSGYASQINAFGLLNSMQSVTVGKNVRQAGDAPI